MKKFFIFALITSTALFYGCSKGGSITSATSPISTVANTDVAAVVNGVNITVGELDQVVKNQMQRIDTQIYQIRKQGLDALIEKRLLEDAAKKKGKNLEEYIKEEIEAKVVTPSEDEIKALYESRKGKDNLPFEKVKDQLISYLKQSKLAKAQKELLASLTKESNVKIVLEPPRVKIELDDTVPTMGPKDAKVTLVEFSDYQCPFCKRVRPTIWQLVDEYKGKLRYVFMDFPLSFHQFAKKAHEAAHCAADQDKYFDYNKKAFDNQANLTVDDLKKYAKELGLNQSKFDKCLDSGQYAKTVEKSQQLGGSLGVSGTPAYFINGVQLSGAQPIDAFKSVIDDELKR